MKARLLTSLSMFFITAAAMVAAACQPVHPTVVVAPPPPSSANVGTQVRVNFLESHMDNLAAVATALPGSDEREFRSLMHDELNEMTQIFPVLAGPGVDDEFQQQIAVLADCRDRLAGMTDESNSDAATTSAIVTATQILHGIAQHQPVDDRELFGDVLDCDQVNGRLDGYQGVLHRAAVGRSARQIVAAMKQAAADYVKEFAATQP
jgi:hypothetical protein